MDINALYDVVIVGAGPSGIAAAVSAGRNGAKTLLIERYGCIGGMSTSGMLTVWCGDASSGIFDEIRRMTTIKRGRRQVFDPERLHEVYRRLLQESAVDMLLHTSLCGVEHTGRQITSLSLLSKSGMVRVQGRIYVDATGDGDLACLAGIPYQKGREQDGLMQPMTLPFMVAGVDESQAVYPTFGTHLPLQELMQQEVASGKVSKPAGHVILIEGYHKGTASVNMTNMIHVDGTDVQDLTRAEWHTRDQIEPIIAFLRRHVPGFKDCYLYRTAAHIGVRETRHFTGSFRLTEQHILNSEVFPDWLVSRAAYSFGNHNLSGSGSDPNNMKYSGQRYTIPLGCFTTREFDNLLLNGRCISGTHMAHASFRVMPICLAMGQGVGTAAALCSKAGTPLQQLDTAAVQKRLLAQGVSAPQA